MSKTEEERQQFLTDLGLNATGDSLSVAVTPTQPAKTTMRLAADGVDPHTMPVTDIVFDPALLDGFPDLSGQGMRAASASVFELYKSPGRNKDRNSLLHSRIGKFIAEVRRSRDTGGHVKEAIRTTRDQRDLAALLATHDITAADLAALIDSKGE